MTKRAAVLIGVKKSGRLPELQATTAGVRLMEGWARDQGFDPVVAITDDGGPVHVRRIKTEIRAIVERGDVTQLLVYFSGHGVNQGYSEFWLLSEAIDDTNEAVNLRGTEYLARYGPVPHVVFVSDACRTAAEGIRAGALTGSEIFPNPDGAGRLQAVDLFYAATLGRPAHEIRDPSVSSRRYRALYTEVLEECLRGGCPDVLELGGVPDTDEGPVGFVRPRRLGEQLPRQVLARLRDLGNDLSVVQEPDALVTSGPDAWLARIDGTGYEDASGYEDGTGTEEPSSSERPGDTGYAPSEATRDFELSGPGGEEVGGGFVPGDLDLDLPEETRSTPAARATLGVPRVSSTGALLNLMLSTSEGLTEDLHRAFRSDLADASFDVGRSAGELPELELPEVELIGPGPDAAEISELGSGFRIRGSRVVRAYAAHSTVKVLADDRVRVALGRGVDDVWLGLADGRATVIPAIPEFFATITFEEGELAGVAYEPVPETSRWEEYRGKRSELGLLRALVADSVRSGIFRPDGDQALRLAERIRRAKGLDPTLAIYAAYAYHDLHREDLLREMRSYLQQDVGVLPYDVALLAGDLRDRPLGGDETVHPGFPLLAQGWSLVRALGGRLPPRLDTLQQHLTPSLWSLFDERGATMLLDFMKGER